MIVLLRAGTEDLCAATHPEPVALASVPTSIERWLIIARPC